MDISVDNGIATIIMDDGKVNAMNTANLDELSRCLDEAESSASAVVLAGREGVFSGGFDLNVMGGDDGDARTEMLHKGATLTSRIFSFPIPVVAAVTGHAVALGAVFAMASDYAVAEEGEYQFALTETAVGVAFTECFSEVITASLNPKFIQSTAVMAKPCDIHEAHEAGFFRQLVPAGKSIEVAREHAKQFSQYKPEVYQANKKSFRGKSMQVIEKDLETFLKRKF